METFGRAKPEEEVRRAYPVQGKGEARGWYFRIEEVSWGHYVVEGVDLWGRMVSRSGSNEAELLLECQNDARAIQEALARR